jgi:hypothetical protein
MSGWENVPKEAPSQPRTPRRRRAAAAPEPAAASDAAMIEDSRLAQLIDLYWPQVWLMMVMIVSLIGTWAAIGKLPNHPSWWP